MIGPSVCLAMLSDAYDLVAEHVHGAVGVA